MALHYYGAILGMFVVMLWRPEAANKVSVTTQMLWPLATTNCGGLEIV